MELPIVKKKDVLISDFPGYLIDLIMNLFKIVFKGKEISKKGSIAFSLFLLTASLLYKNTTFPESIIDIIKLYSWPLIFFSYFMVDALQNFDSFSRLLRKIQQKTNLAYEDIINNKCTASEIENLLYSSSFTCEQLRDIISYLRQNNQFTRSGQYNLLLKSSDFKTNTDNYIQHSLIKKDDDWDSLAVCTYIKHKKFNLNRDFIINLFDKYGNDLAVAFTIGRYQHFAEAEGLKNDLLLAGKNTHKGSSQKIIISLLKIFGVVPIIWVLLNYPIPITAFDGIIYLALSAIFIPVWLNFSNWGDDKLNETRVKKSLKEQNINLSTIDINKFLEDIS